MRTMLLLLFALISQLASAFRSPDTTGPYTTGVQDGEFLDFNYASPFQTDRYNGGGRKLMYRVWYPACPKQDVIIGIDQFKTVLCRTNSSMGDGTHVLIDLGRRRKWMEEGEWEVYVPAGIEEDLEEDDLEEFDAYQSYLDAPPITRKGTFPLVMYAHGLGRWVSDNGALLEEIASHGYVVVSVASPGFARGVKYSDESTLRSLEDYPEIDHARATPPTFTDKLQERYDRTKSYLLNNGGFGKFVQRARDDLWAIANHVWNDLATSNSSIFYDLLDTSNQKMVYMGFSFGGAVATSAAHGDNRAVGAINLDGGMRSLLDTQISVPYLDLNQNDNSSRFYYFNEFFLEDVDTMGSRTNITRIQTPLGTSHLDFMDYRLMENRSLLGVDPIDTNGTTLHTIISEFCLGFLDHTLKDGNEWDLEEMLQRFDGVEPIDVSYVANANIEPGEPLSLSSSMAASQYNFWAVGLFAACCALLFTS